MDVVQRRLPLLILFSDIFEPHYSLPERTFYKSKYVNKHQEKVVIVNLWYVVNLW